MRIFCASFAIGQSKLPKQTFYHDIDKGMPEMPGFGNWRVVYPLIPGQNVRYFEADIISNAFLEKNNFMFWLWFQWNKLHMVQSTLCQYGFTRQFGTEQATSSLPEPMMTQFTNGYIRQYYLNMCIYVRVCACVCSSLTVILWTRS